MAIQAIATSAVDVQSVGGSWIQANKDRFLFTKLPKARCKGRKTGYSRTTTYALPSLDNFMLKNDLIDRDAGNPSPPSRPPTSSTVTLECRGKATPHKNDREADRPTAHRFEDLEKNLIPGQLSLLYQGIEKAVLTNIFSTTFGPAQTWNAGGNVLDEISSSINPILDIEAAIEDLRRFAGQEGMSLEAIMDRRIARYLAQYTQYTGAGAGSNSSAMLPHDALIQRLKDVHGFNDVHIIDTTRDSVKYGQTSSLAHAGAGGLAIGVFDRSFSEADLTYSESMDSPDGAFLIGFEKEPYVQNWVDEDGEVEYFHGRVNYGITNPRGAAFGVHWPASANIT